jgi:hypothetical protein
LRELVFVPGLVEQVELEPGDAVFTGADAYRFTLEVACGLHSPLTGETEVMGQFRTFVGQVAGPGTRWRGLSRWLHQVLTDAKAVRTQHLTSIGCRSYGALVARYLENCGQIEVIGAGHLARQLLPALAGYRVVVHCRNIQRAAIASRHRDILLVTLGEQRRVPPADRSALILAAPVSAAQVRHWLSPFEAGFTLVIDLREESGRDPLELATTPVIPFARVLDAVQANSRNAALRVEAARRDIHNRAVKFSCRDEVRPFGWEDLCA